MMLLVHSKSGAGLPLMLVLVMSLIGCRASQSHSDPPPEEVPSLAQTQIKPLKKEGLHQLFQVSADLYSGSSPESDAAFASLKELGIRTILSVDGATPEIAKAEKYGLRYVHLPIGYDGISRERLLQLVKARQTLPSPIYVHCHHGKHRGPAVVAALQLCTDPQWDAQTATQWLDQAGTDPRYKGLFHLPKNLVKPTAEELARSPEDFPSIAPVPDLTRVMVQIDHHWDRLKLVQAAAWQVPRAHPSIEPAHEALQILEHYRESRRFPAAQNYGMEFLKRLQQAEGNVAELEKQLRTPPSEIERLNRLFSKAQQDCFTCHGAYRDNR
jgi:protein tyrosine phosphatase (PTP) superfamily phosphohydrolase (DUF442 family)